MAYTFNNFELAREMYNSEWYRVADWQVLARALARVDYSVVDSRRTGHDAVNEFRDDAVTVPFERTTRFPNEMRDLFLTNHTAAVSKLMIELCSVLSYRTGNVAKDTNAVTESKGPGGRGDKDIAIVNDQAVQDNAKRFETLCILMGQYANTKDMCYTRESFEFRTGAIWA